MYSSAGLTIWQKRHMPRAPRFWGPRAYSLLFPPEFFVPCFSAGPKQCASAGPQRAQVPQKMRGPKLNLKSEAPESGAPNVFFFPCFSVSAGVPKGPRSPKTLGPQNLKIVAPNVLFCSLFQREIQTTRHNARSKQGPQNGAPK